MGGLRNVVQVPSARLTHYGLVWLCLVVVILVIGGHSISAVAATSTPRPTRTARPTSTPHPSKTPTITPTPSPTRVPLKGKIAFFSNRAKKKQFDLYVMNADGSNVTRLAELKQLAFAPSWSPDGKRIIFWVDTGRRFEYYPHYHDDYLAAYIVDADGGNLTRLFEAPSYGTRITWSPDGTRIAFDSWTGHNSADIFVANLDGSKRKVLTLFPTDDVSPVWSPDGTRIVFCVRIDGPCDLYVMNADGTKPTRLIGSNHNEIFPAWSPDSMRIFYVADARRVNRYETYVMNADGSNVTRLSPQFPADFAGYVTWSPDRTHIAFNIAPTAGHVGIYVANVDLGDMYRISDNRADDWSPVWSPQ
jgi:Tol biopolymer transport system component